MIIEQFTFNEPLILALTFTQESTKRTIVVTSYKIIDLLGEYGGFLEVVSIIFTFFGSKFSSRYFNTAVVTKNYLKKTE